MSHEIQPDQDHLKRSAQKSGKMLGSQFAKKNKETFNLFSDHKTNAKCLQKGNSAFMFTRTLHRKKRWKPRINQEVV